MSQTALTTPTLGSSFENQTGTEPRTQPIGNAPGESTRAAALPDTGQMEIGGQNLGLLLDVELNVLLRFGQRSLTLREVLDLKCGSVIELDHRVDEPVELLLDGRVIARGHAAIVDGNYGLQVTEVLQSSARLRAANGGQETWR